MGSSSLRFAETVRVLSATAHGLGLRVPAFRSPPHTPGRDRAVSRPRGEPVVAVRVPAACAASAATNSSCTPGDTITRVAAVQS